MSAAEDNADCRRNYRIVALSERNTVVVELVDDLGGGGMVRRDTGESPAAWGDFGLSRTERGILRKGLTRSGRARGTGHTRMGAKGLKLPVGPDDVSYVTKACGEGTSGDEGCKDHPLGMGYQLPEGEA